MYHSVFTALTVTLSNHLSFGPFSLDTETGELWKEGERVKLSPRPAQLLMLLARSPGRLLTREQIRHELWGSETFVDFEHALNFCIREVRAALGDRPTQPRYIETLPRRGYRFLGGEQPQSRKSNDPELEAYNHYARARQALAQFGKDTLAEARQHFEAALRLHPDYGMAHSGLGSSLALQSLNRRDPEELQAARYHLERALELDPELSEPYPWLCFVLMRSNQLDRAIAAGQRGIDLQPDLVHAHYFLGVAHFNAAETHASHYGHAVRHLLDAGRVGPHWQPSWFVLAYAALLTGEYAQAEAFAHRLLHFQQQPQPLPFIGAEIILATVALRRGEPDRALRISSEFLDRMLTSQHMYRDGMSAAAACVRGDAELRHSSAAAALASYRRAWQTVQEHPRIMSYRRSAARAEAGLAAAYAASGDRARAAELFAHALATAGASHLPEHNAAAAALSEVYWALATAAVRLSRSDHALHLLDIAIGCGARDPAWLANDPEFQALHAHPQWARLCESIRRDPVDWQSVPLQPLVQHASASQP